MAYMKYPVMSISCGFGCRALWGSEEAPKQASLVVVVGWDSGAKELFLQNSGKLVRRNPAVPHCETRTDTYQSNNRDFCIRTPQTGELENPSSLFQVLAEARWPWAGLWASQATSQDV